MFEDIEFEAPAKLDPAELAAFYKRQLCGTECSPQKLQRMVDRTFCLVTARHRGELIGLARGVTDGVRGQLVECKLDPAFQGPGCVTKKDGRIEHDFGGLAAEMARRVVSSLLDYGVERIGTLAYETEVDFCEELGFKKMQGLVPMQCTASEWKDSGLMATSLSDRV